MEEDSKPTHTWIVVLAIGVAIVLAAVAAALLPARLVYPGLMVLSAVIPALVTLFVFIRSDRFPEPPEVIYATFVLGVLAIVPALFLSNLLGGFFDTVLSFLGWFGLPVSWALIHAGVAEETAKFAVIMRYCARHSAFDEPMDGLVYGVTASLGFAALENVFYVLGDPSWPAWTATAIMRGFTAVPAHGVDGAVMGFFVGLSHALPARRRQLLRAAWGVPVVLHAAYDLPLFLVTASTNDWAPVLGQLWFIIFFLELGMARWMLRMLQRIQDRYEEPEAVVQQAWRALLCRLHLPVRDLPLPSARTPDLPTVSVPNAADRPNSDVDPGTSICPRCFFSRAVCACPPPDAKQAGAKAT